MTNTDHTTGKTISVTDAPVEDAAGIEDSSVPRGSRRPRVIAGVIAVLVLLLLGWHFAVASGLVAQIIVPYPLDVAFAIVELSQNALFWKHAWITTFETLVGFAIGGVVGFALGALLGTSRPIREVMFPYVVAFQGLPKVVLAPVFVTAFGFGITSKIAMAVVLAFFPVLVNTMAGLLSVDAEGIKLMRSYNASKWKTFRTLTLPHSLPFVFAGLKTSLTFALIGAIVGEFVGASEGLGYLLNLYAYQLRIPDVWAIMVVLALLGVLLYAAIELVDRKLIFWRAHRDLQAGM